MKKITDKSMKVMKAIASLVTHPGQIIVLEDGTTITITAKGWEVIQQIKAERAAKN